MLFPPSPSATKTASPSPFFSSSGAAASSSSAAPAPALTTTSFPSTDCSAALEKELRSTIAPLYKHFVHPTKSDPQFFLDTMDEWLATLGKYRSTKEGMLVLKSGGTGSTAGAGAGESKAGGYAGAKAAIVRSGAKNKSKLLVGAGKKGEKRKPSGAKKGMKKNIIFGAKKGKRSAGGGKGSSKKTRN